MASQEILDYMLGKGHDSPAKLSSFSTDAPSQANHHSPSRKVQSLAKSFAKTLVHDWLETDETLERLVHSIANLRQRLWLTSRWLFETTENPPQPEFGYRTNPYSLLSVDDLQLALDHDLRQHEKMMAMLRRVMSEASQSQDALGRRLDEYMQLQLQIDDEIATRGSSNGKDMTSWLPLPECQMLYTATAIELYRKQMLSEQVLESGRDGLLYIGELSNKVVEEIDPRKRATNCSNQWSRKHETSALKEYENLIESITVQVS